METEPKGTVKQSGPRHDLLKDVVVGHLRLHSSQGSWALLLREQTVPWFTWWPEISLPRVATSQIPACLTCWPLDNRSRSGRWGQCPQWATQSVFGRCFCQKSEMAPHWGSSREWGWCHLPRGLQAPWWCAPFCRKRRPGSQSSRQSGCSGESERRLGQGEQPQGSERHRLSAPMSGSSRIPPLPVQSKRNIRSVIRTYCDKALPSQTRLPFEEDARWLPHVHGG